MSMNLTIYAKSELELAFPKSGDKEADEMQELIHKNILEIVEVFANQGHSGSTAPYVINILKKLLYFEPIKPLTGEPNEWMEIDDNKYQNKRCGRVFKDGDRVYDIDGKVFTDQHGCSFTSKESAVDVTFPYTPKTEYVDVIDDGKGNWKVK